MCETIVFGWFSFSLVPDNQRKNICFTCLKTDVVAPFSVVAFDEIKDRQEWWMSDEDEMRCDDLGIQFYQSFVNHISKMSPLQSVRCGIFMPEFSISSCILFNKWHLYSIIDMGSTSCSNDLESLHSSRWTFAFAICRSSQAQHQICTNFLANKSGYFLQSQIR